MIQLKGSPYEPLLKEITQPSATKLQRIFKEEFMRVYNRILNASPKPIRGFMESYLRCLEIENLKILIKMKNMKAPSGSILKALHLYVEETFRMKEKFIQAAKARDVNAVIEIFKNTLYGPILSEGLKRYEETGLTKFFDFSLDRSYHDELLSSASSLPRGEREIALLLAGLRADSFNIVVALRSKFLDYPPHLIFWAITQRFYRLSEKQVRNMVSSSDISSALSYVKESFYGRFLGSQDNIEELITAFEKRVNRFIMKKLSGKRIVDPFSIATPLDVILRKEMEIKNLTSISSGMELGWKSEDIISILL